MKDHQKRRRTILVTGDSSGIGLSLRQHLLSCGHAVVGVARTERASNEPMYRAISFDLSRLQDFSDILLPQLNSGPPLDVVVLNAASPLFGHLEELSPRHIEANLRLNLLSPILLARLLLPGLKTRPAADVILLGSESALHAGRQGSIYSAAKFGLRGFAQALRAECATSGVRVTLIHPGMVDTPWFDELDFGPGEEAGSALRPSDLHQAVDLILEARPGVVFEEILVKPQQTQVRKRKR